MDLEVIEKLTLSSDGAGGTNGPTSHWSRNAARPRYSLNKEEMQQRTHTQRFTCFDVAEAVESEYDVLFAGRTNGVVVLWRIVPRNLFGGANKDNCLEETLNTNFPHKGAVTCLTHTRRGAYGALGGPLLFSGATDHTIKVWNAWGGSPSKDHCLQTLAEHRRGITGLTFAGGSTLISIARDGCVRLWHPQRGRKLLRFPFFCCVKCVSNFPSPCSGVIRSPAPGQPGVFVNVWPTVACVGGGEHWTLYCGDSDGNVTVFHRNPAAVAERRDKVGSRSNGVAMEELPDSEVTLQRRWSHLHSLAVSYLGLVPEHNFLLSLGNDGVCRVLDYLQGNMFMSLESDGHALFTSVAWDLAHEQLVLSDAAGVVQVWNTYTGSSRRYSECARLDVWLHDWLSGDEPRAAVKFVDASSLLLREKVANAVPATGPRRGHGSPALLGFYSSKADGVLYGMSPAEGCLFRWKLVKVDDYAILGRHDDTIVGLSFREANSSNRRVAVAAAEDPTSDAANPARAEYKLKSDDVAGAGSAESTGKPRTKATNRGERTGVDKRESEDGASSNGGGGGEEPGVEGGRDRGMCGNSSDREEGEGEEEEEFEPVLLSACVDGTVRAWEMLGMSEKYRMRHAPGDEVTSMLVLPGGSVMATGVDSGSVRFWRLDTGASESFQAHDNTVSALAACWDSQQSLLFASGGFGGAIVLWAAHAKDGIGGNRIPKMESVRHRAHGAVENGSDCEILCLAFVAADDPLLASAGNDLVVKIWQVRDSVCALLATLEGHADSVETLLADGVYLLSGGCDGTIRVWNACCLAFDENRRVRDNTSDRGSSGNNGMAGIQMAGVFAAHSGGVASMAVMANAPEMRSSAVTATPLLEDGECRSEVVSGEETGLLMTCGKVEGIVKIWDYTYVGEGGTCGRLITEVRPPKVSLFTCVACSQASNGERLLFAGTADGCILRLAWSSGHFE